MTEDFNAIFNNSQYNTEPNIITLESSSINQHNVIHTNLPNSAEIATQVVKAIEPLFLRLTNEIQSLRKDVQELRNQKIKIKRRIMPAQPFKEMEDFLTFEKSLQENSELFAAFENELSVVAQSPSFIKNCWRKIFVDELALKLCWKGTEEKKSVRKLSTAIAIRNGALSLGIGEYQFTKETRTFFQFAKNRVQLRENYKNRKL